MTTALNEKLQNLPDSPGVYIYKNLQNKIIYIGKAKNLKHRVRSYFNIADDNRQFYTYLLQHIHTVDWLVTNTEQESLILENSLIKQFKPKYNIELKDDKNFYSIRLRVDQLFPRLEFVREPKEDGAKYFGPFTSATSLKKTIQFLNQTFKLRTCTDFELENRKRACILYQINKCSAPCVDKIKTDEYHVNIKKIEQFLKGHSKEILQQLKSEMQLYSDQMKYEKAMELRDQIRAIEKTIESQHIVDNDFIDRDVFTFFDRNNKLYIQGLFIRDCVIRSYYSNVFDLYSKQPNQLFVEFLQQFYSQTPYLPEEVIIPTINEDVNLLEEHLSNKRKVKFIVPQKGNKKQLLELADKNARENANTIEAERVELENTLQTLKEQLKLKNTPYTMECYDISNIQGHFSVASGVAFKNGKPNRKMYKKYKIKTVDQANDFASLNEIIHRRVQRGLKEDNLPNLIVIDGGKGQLNAAIAALQENNVEIDIIGIAKARTQKGTVDRFFLPETDEPVYLPENSKALYMLMNIRDEAHRFAITFHRKLRGNQFKEDPLFAINGIGPLKRKALLKHFGNIGAIRAADKEELLKVEGITSSLADIIIEKLSLQ